MSKKDERIEELEAEVESLKDQVFFFKGTVSDGETSDEEGKLVKEEVAFLEHKNAILQGLVEQHVKVNNDSSYGPLAKALAEMADENDNIQAILKKVAKKLKKQTNRIDKTLYIAL